MVAGDGDGEGEGEGSERKPRKREERVKKQAAPTHSRWVRFQFHERESKLMKLLN